MRTILLLALLLTATPAAAADQGINVAKDYLVALQDTMHGNATPEAVDRVVNLFSENAVYEDPRVGAHLAGRDQMRAGRMNFLHAYGGSRNDVHFRINSLTSGPGVVFVDMQVSFKAKAAGGGTTLIGRRQLATIEVKDDKIVRLIDYW